MHQQQEQNPLRSPQQPFPTTEEQSNQHSPQSAREAVSIELYSNEQKDQTKLESDSNIIHIVSQRQQTALEEEFYEFQHHPGDKQTQRISQQNTYNAEQALWTNFIKSIQQINLDQSFFLRLKKSVDEKGFFSPETFDLIKSELKGTHLNKTQKAFRNNVLKKLIQPILTQIDIKLEDLQTQAIEDLYKSIGSRNQEGIVQFLEDHTDPEGEIFVGSVQSLLKLYKPPKKQQIPKHTEVQDIPGNKQDQNEQLVRKINVQTEQLKKALERKKINIQGSFIESIMINKFNHGAFSKQIDQCIKSLPTQIKVRTQVQKTFDELFRNFQIPLSIKEQLMQIGLEQEDFKDIKTLIRKGEEKKLQQKLTQILGQEQQSQTQKTQLLQDLMNLRPKQNAPKSRLNVTPPASLSDIESPLKQKDLQIQTLKVQVQKNTQYSQSVVPEQNKQTKQTYFQKAHGMKVDKPEATKIKENNNDNDFTSSSIKQSDTKIQIEEEHDEEPIKLFSTKSDFKREVKPSPSEKIVYREKISLPLATPGPYNVQTPQESKSKIQILSHIKIDNQLQQDPQYTSNLNENQRSYGVKQLQSWVEKPFELTKKQQFPTLLLRNPSKKTNDFSQFNGFNLQPRQPYTQIGNDHNFNEVAKYYNSQHFERGGVQQQKMIGSKKYRNKYEKERNGSDYGVFNYERTQLDVRYVCIMHYRQTNFQIRKDKENFIHPNLIEKKQYKNLVAEIFRLQFDTKTQSYSVQVPKGGFFGYFTSEHRVVLSRKMFVDKYFHIQYLTDDKSKYTKQALDLAVYYLMALLNIYSREKEYTKFWMTLINHNKTVNLGAKEWQYSLCSVDRFLQANRINLDSESSRLFLYFIVTYVHKNRNPMSVESPLLSSIAFALNFEECNFRPTFFKQSYTFEYQTKLISYCMLIRLSRNLHVHEQPLVQNLSTTCILLQNFNEKMGLIKFLRRQCNQKLEQLYPIIKQTIDLRNYSLFQFLAMRLTLINIEKPRIPSHHIQKHTNFSLDDFKRTWIIQMIKEISNFVDHLPENEIKTQNQHINRVKNGEYGNEARQILLGKNSNAQYFLFNHQLFYDFYSELVYLKQRKKFELIQLFEKFAEGRKIKAMEYVIMHTQKSSNLISFMCSLGSDKDKTLQNMIKRLQPKTNLLNVVTFWFKDEFKEQNNAFFIDIFNLLMNSNKTGLFTPYEFMRTIEGFHKSDRMSKHVEKFTETVFQKIKRLPQLSPDLKLHLTEIKDIKESIKKIYLEELVSRLQESKEPLQKLQKSACEILWQNLIPKPDKQFILKRLFSSRNDKSNQSIREEIIEYYSLCKKELKVLGYYNNFKKTLKELIGEIKSKQISYTIIEVMRKPKIKMVTQLETRQFRELAQIIQQNVKEMQNLKKKSYSLIKVFKSYGNLFVDEIQTLEEWNRKVPTTQIKTSLGCINRFIDYLNYADEIDSLMKIPLWEHEQINQIEDILNMRKKTINEYKKLIDSFQKQSLSFTDFKKYFKIQILSTLLENVKDRDQPFKEKLELYINYLDDRTLTNFVISIESLNEICSRISKKEFFENAYLETIKFLQNPTQEITIQEAFKKVKSVDSKLKELNFEILEEDEEILKTLIFKCKYQRVFEMITEKKIDSSTVLNDLKEYINDVENSILKIQDIKELENVVLFNEILSKASNFKGFLQDLRKEVQTKRLKLSEYIFNVDSKVKLFEQMIDSSANRQTSFKYDLQQIFKDSVVRIKQEHGLALVGIVLNQKNQKTQGENHRKEDGSIEFTFKKLTQLKDKAILLVSDFERSNQHQSILQQTIDLFKDYLALYKILQEIQLSLQKVIVYGYNPSDLKQEQSIVNKNFTSIMQMKTEIEILSRDWIQGMKDIYEKSYLLTHFMGPKLNAFINDTLEFRFSPLIKRIVDLDEVEFGKRMDSLKFINANQGINSPIDKVKQICRMFQKIELQTLRRIQKNSLVEEGNFKNQIELITCNKVEYYYFALVKGNSKPEMNEILYCQKQTSFEEIEVFIKRAIIKNHRKHYFIGVHYLPVEVQLKFIDLLNEYLKTEDKRNKFSRCKLCLIDDSPKEKVYLHLQKKQLFDVKNTTDTHLKTVEESHLLLKNIGQTYLIQSRIPGLGKTYWAQKKNPRDNIIYFSIGGHVHFSRLLQRLKAKIFVDAQPDVKNTLILQIGHVENKNKLEIFLFQLIFFKGFNFKEFFYLPKNTTVVIEMQNVYDTEDKYQYYSILKIIKENKEKYVRIEDFNLSVLQPNFDQIQEAFTFNYLMKMCQKTILREDQRFDRFQLQFKKNPHMRICSKDDARKLIQLYFIDQLKKSKTEPTFWLYKSFIKLLFTAFKTFSLNGCFDIPSIDNNNRSNKNLGLANVRLDFLNCCVRNSIQFLQATINTNQFEQDNEKVEQKNEGNQKNSEEDFRDTLSKFPFLIMTDHSFHNYEFVYLNLNSEGVSLSLKSLYVSQSIYKYVRFNKHGYDQNTLLRKLDTNIVSNLFSQNALENLRDENLERQIYRILHQLSGNQTFNIDEKQPIKTFKEQREEIKNYSITLDNFFKMCLIIQRAISNIPIIIMGESGVGKTALISFLVKVVFGHELQIFNIHAGIDEQKLFEFYGKILQASEKIKHQARLKVWVFFDEFNTTDQLSYIKEMIIDRKFEGQPIPQNVVLIGACNPYRRKKQSNFKKAGIKKKGNQSSSKNQTNLAFKVKPPPLSMIQFMWDYQQLQFKENLRYISKILQSLSLVKHDRVVETIAFLHEDFKNRYEISAVSLRDVARFKELFLWFLEKMPDYDDSIENKKDINPNYKIDREERAISLSIAFCYSLRIADRQQRKELLRVITKQLQFDVPIQQVVENQQTDYVRRLKVSTEKIAINFSLRQNVFTTLVCLMNKIPILIVGNPGNSKSLSIRMISSNLRGLNSQSEFCRAFPELSIIYFQGSQACTSKGVEAVFDKAISSNKQFKEKKIKQPGLGDVQNCILFDEIGLAQKSPHNPLKVLHSKLETSNKEICFIGISNWQLDAAKMSRFLVLSRSNPQKEQLRDTAFKILESYINRQAYKHEKVFREMSDWYYEFVRSWDLKYKEKYEEGFFGLRDFYCYIKYVAEQLEKESKASIKNIIRKSILTNFDGQQGSVQMFLQISGMQVFEDQHVIDPIKLVQENLNKDSSRSLLLIVRGDALLPIIKDKLKINGQKHRIECIYGSTFALDQQSQQYNLQMTSIIISHMSRGTILTFKNPNDSIQTSLYDVFNKSFTQSGSKKYCRVAVGANSNPKCVVHKDFGSIVFMDEQIIKNTDLAFLNRFEKHFLTLSNVLSQYERQIVSQIKSWIEILISFKQKTIFKKQEHYLINSSEESIVTLVLKHRQSLETYKQSGIKKIKKALLKNATEHFFIAFRVEDRNFINISVRTEVGQLLKQIKSQRNGQSSEMNETTSFEDIMEEEPIPKDKIIFTYDEAIYSAPTYMFYTEKTLKIRISEVKSESQLRKLLKDAFVQDRFDNVHILIDFHNEFQHVNFISFLLTSIKYEFKSNKTVYIIIKMAQSSLENSGRDHINISYLLDFEQRFIDSLTLGKSFMDAIQNKTVKDIYLERRMEEKIDNYYIEAQKRFRLLQNEKDIPKNIPAKDILDFQFGEMMRMHENTQFKKQAIKFVHENLSEKKIDASVILQNKQDRLLCTSPQQSFEKFMQNSVIQTLCLFFQRVYKNNLLFSFDVPRLFKFYKKYYDVQILEIIYDQSKDVYDKFAAHALDAFVNYKAEFVHQYLKNYNSNHLEIKSLCLLPVGLRQLQYISSNTEDSLFKISSKILEQSVEHQAQVVQECQILMEKCISIINEKSVFIKSSMNKKNAFDFEGYLNQNPSLQIFYFFDMISKIYSESLESLNIDTKVFPLQKLVYLFVQLFKKLQIKQKIILLSLSKELWSNVFNIWSLWITHNQENFHRKMEDHYLQNVLLSRVRTQAHELPQLLTQLCRSTLVLQEKLLQLDIKNIENYGIEKYLSFFRKTYFYAQKIRLTCMDLKVDASETMKSTKRFFDLLDRIFQKDQIQEQLTIFLTTQQTSFQAKVERYLSEVLKSDDLRRNDVQHILSYLSLDIYSSWIKRLKQAKQRRQFVDGEIKNCIYSFIQYSNKFSSFANNSSFFLQNIFEYLIDNVNTIEQKLQYMEHENDEMTNIINDNLKLRDNFAVALGNFFMNNIQQCAAQEEQNAKQTIGIHENLQQSFIKKYLKHFQDSMLRTNYHSKIFEIFTIEFIKYYCVQYLNALQKQEQHSITWRIDEILNQGTNLADTIRLYLLKKILYQQQKMTVVKQMYLDNRRCKWLEHFRVLVSGKTFELLVPPPFEEESKKMAKLIANFRQEQYEKIEIFGEMLKESFSSPITKYEFLTFMMNDIYTMSCPEDRVIKISEIINKSEYYKDRQNTVEYNLLKCYLNHRVSSAMKCELKELQSPQKKIQQFVNTQLVYLNFLNIFVACNREECPLIEMFFTLQGNVPQNYVDWLEKRFLVNGRQNQSVSILKRFIELGDNTPGYYKCSAKCDMFYTIGGSGGFGCQFPKVQGKCGWCNGTIGGTNHNLTRASEGARKVNITDLPAEMQIIREKKKLSVLNQKLNGYSYSTNTQEMIKEVESNKRLPESVKYVLQQMIFSVWSSLCATELLKPEDVKEIFRMNSNSFEHESFEIIQHFHKLSNRTINLNEQDQSSIIWHLGISKEIMKFMIGYKSQLSSEMKQRMGLVKCIGRDTFEQYLVNNVILKYSSGNQKLALINRSRCLRAGINLSGQEILKQNGGFEQYLEKYPKIRLIKLLYEDKIPCFVNLVKEYKEIINRDFKILAYYIQNEEQIERLRKYRTLYAFITKILKLFNMKITRRDAQTKSIFRLYEEVYQNSKEQKDIGTSNLNIFRNQLMEFCNVWNQLREMKLELRYGCHSLGFFNEVTEKLQISSCAINFFPDVKYKGDQKGQMILSLLQVTSQQYNETCRAINHLKMGERKYRQVQIFNPKPINPTQIQPLTKTLELSRQLVEGEFITSYSNWSVQYGCGLPHYPIDKIESLIVQSIVGCHNLNEQIKEYDSINFIGEQLNFIVQIRELNNQEEWEKIPKKEQLEKYIYVLKHDEPDSFLKEINSIKGSLELILHYCRLQKGESFQKMTIQDFIKLNKIMVLSKVLLTEELFYSLEMRYILTLYEFIELYTLKNSVQCLVDSYKKQKLTQAEFSSLKNFFDQLKKQFKPQEDMEYQLSVALYRFVARSLLLAERNEDLDLFSFLYEGADLWPNKFDISKLAELRYFHEAFSIKLTKTQSLLDVIPLTLKKTKTELIFVDQKKTIQQTFAKNQPQKLKPAYKMPKKRVNY